MALSPFIFHTVEGRIIFFPIYIYICVWFFTTVCRVKDSKYFLKAKIANEFGCIFKCSMHKDTKLYIKIQLRFIKI